MSTVQEASAQATGVATQRVAQARRPRPSRWRGNWWRHLVAILGIAFALFPVLYILSAAFDANPALGSAKLFPRQFTLHNFGTLFHDPTSAYGWWYLNTLIVGFATAIFTVLLGALAAYAFSRFRFRGRRVGMLFLLLVQMFPQLLGIVAIYLIVLKVGKVFPVIGLNRQTALILVYLGGSMGIQAWLLKGFFDTIPQELDEAARVDGATPAQVFWGVILPLGAPALAVVGLLSFIFTVNEFPIASVLLQTQHRLTLPVGMQGFIDQKYAEHWGPFAAGALLSLVPVVVLFQFLQRFIVQGLAGAVKG